MRNSMKKPSQIKKSLGDYGLKPSTAGDGTTGMQWDDLDFWQSGEWQVIQERLEDYDKKKIEYCPKREDLFKALDAVPFDKVKVVIVGQDPYPDPQYATGIAFDIPKHLRKFPPTLKNILAEYSADLHHTDPVSGSLQKWTDQGVLLWNAIPTCEADKSLSHEDWTEWTYLNKEIFEKLSGRNIVFAFLGRIAREWCAKYLKPDDEIISVSHPSPRGNMFSKTPYLGSRMFSTINDKLRAVEQETIDWRL